MCGSKLRIQNTFLLQCSCVYKSVWRQKVTFFFFLPCTWHSLFDLDFFFFLLPVIYCPSCDDMVERGKKLFSFPKTSFFFIHLFLQIKGRKYDLKVNKSSIPNDNKFMNRTMYESNVFQDTVLLKSLCSHFHCNHTWILQFSIMTTDLIKSFRFLLQQGKLMHKHKKKLIPQI